MTATPPNREPAAELARRAIVTAENRRSRCRLCRCSRPDRQRDADGVACCGNCGELRPDNRDELLAAIVVKLDKLGREVEHLGAKPGAPS
jgi:hypothetical protein